MRRGRRKHGLRRDEGPPRLSRLCALAALSASVLLSLNTVAGVGPLLKDPVPVPRPQPGR